jgi:hypothetical protein
MNFYKYKRQSNVQYKKYPTALPVVFKTLGFTSHLYNAANVPLPAALLCCLYVGIGLHNRHPKPTD